MAGGLFLRHEGDIGEGLPKSRRDQCIRRLVRLGHGAAVGLLARLEAVAAVDLENPVPRLDGQPAHDSGQLLIIQGRRSNSRRPIADGLASLMMLPQGNGKKSAAEEALSAPGSRKAIFQRKTADGAGTASLTILELIYH